MRELLLIAVFAPGVAFLLLGGGWLFGLNFGEKLIARLSALTYGISTAALAGAALLLWQSGSGELHVPYGEWFRVGDYHFPVDFLFDRISGPLLALTAILTGLIGAFSRTYMHREPGYFRFFLLLHLFGFGAMFGFAAGNFDLLIAGWELVGISSVLLIAFFCQRRAPVENAIRVFVTYRSADVGLLIGVFLLHHFGHSSGLQDVGQHLLTPGMATVVGMLLLLASMGKAAQVPFSGWLPRAMEGPTPSSAIFYGAISVHLGVYLLLRTRPLLADAPLALAIVVAIGVLTALHGMIVGRACADAKTQLAYGAVTQLGLIVAEIGMGWTTLALLHILGHSTVRTLQFLRAPSMLHEYHRIHAAAGGHLETGLSFEAMLPDQLRRRLYWFAIDRGHFDGFLEANIVRPILALSAWLNRIEEGLFEDSKRSQQPKELAAKESLVESIDA